MWKLLPLLALALTVSASAQEASLVKTEYTRLDQIRKANRSLLTGSKGELVFSLVEIRNLGTGEVIQGVEIEVNNQDKERVGGSFSLALSNIGSFWGGGVGSSVVYRRIRESGFLFLGSEELRQVIDFLNEVIAATGEPQSQFKLYKLALGDTFELGMMYDANDVMSESKWRFLFTVGEATYTLEYRDGIEMIQALSRYRRSIDAATQTQGDP